MRRFFTALVVLVVLILLPFGIAFTYQITRFSAGEDQYTLSEPTIDWSVFRGRSVPVVMEDDFLVLMFEGSSENQGEWVTICLFGDKETKKLVILSVTIHEGVRSGDTAKMKTNSFFHKAFIETGKPDFKLLRMSQEPDLKKFIEDRLLRSKAKKNSI